MEKLKSMHLRLGPKTIRMLKALSESWEVSMTDVVRRLIQQAHEREAETSLARRAAEPAEAIGKKDNKRQ